MLYSNALQSKASRERKFDDILKWISPDSDNSITPEPLAKVAGSHRKFIESEPYSKWVGQGTPALICSGQRTFNIFSSISDFIQLALGSHILCSSSLVSTLPDFSSLIFHRLHEDPKLGISYFFFNHSNREETAEKAIRALLRQVVAQSPRIPGDVATEYSRYISDPHKMPTTQDKFTSLLKSSLKQFPSSPSFILIDAYDEFRNTHDEDWQRMELCSALFAICGDRSARILITTRPHWRHELKDAFRDESQIAAVKGDLADVEKYLDLKIQPFNRLDQDLKSNIKRTILDANREEAW